MVEKRVAIEKEVEIPAETVKLQGILHLPPQARGMVLFVQGSENGQLRMRNQLISKFFQEGGFGTLRFDLLTIEEEKDDMMNRELRFNIPFLAHRLILATKWAQSQFKLNVGYFGTNTGAAAAIVAAAELGPKVNCVVSRGGRSDLAGQSLARIQAPTLRIVGGADFGVVELNERALEMMTCEKRLEIVPNATHLFEEPGSLEEVGRMATVWFENYL